VTAAARANAALGHPFFVAHADGAYVHDPEGRAYLDACNSNGATLLGHGHPAIAAAIRVAADLGIACAYDGPEQVRLAERFCEQIPAFDMVRFTTSGTEATWYATRIARAYTGRPLIVKFEGHFHGFNDALAFSFWPRGDEGGPADAPIVRPESLGMPPDAASHVLVLPFNDAAAFQRVVAAQGDRIAAVILEPINFDAGAIVPAPGFLEMLRAETTTRGIVLIFDEILSGYRTGPTGAQGHFGITPDLATLGKAIGGGVPLSVVGGSRDLMSIVAPLGGAVHTGTYNANLIPVMAAHAFLDTIAESGFWDHLLGVHERLYRGLATAFAQAGLPVRVQGVGARCGLYFGLDPAMPVVGYRQAARFRWDTMVAFAREMHTRGVYFNPAWHHGISAAFSEADVDRVVEAAGASAAAVTRSMAVGAAV
jgi:glutamate-1-semialdehyde 2,1-aminomutase